MCTAHASPLTHGLLLAFSTFRELCTRRYNEFWNIFITTKRPPAPLSRRPLQFCPPALGSRQCIFCLCCLCPSLYIIGSIQCMVLWDWCLLRNIRFLKFIHVVIWIHSLFLSFFFLYLFLYHSFPWLNTTPVYDYMTIYLSLPWVVDIHTVSGCYIMTIYLSLHWVVNIYIVSGCYIKAAVNTQVQVIFIAELWACVWAYKHVCVHTCVLYVHVEVTGRPYLSLSTQFLWPRVSAECRASWPLQVFCLYTLVVQGWQACTATLWFYMCQGVKSGPSAYADKYGYPPSHLLSPESWNSSVFNLLRNCWQRDLRLPSPANSVLVYSSASWHLPFWISMLMCVS